MHTGCHFVHFTITLHWRLHHQLCSLVQLTVVQSPIRGAHCTLHTVHCALCTAPCALHTVHCTVHTAHCALHYAQFHQPCSPLHVKLHPFIPAQDRSVNQPTQGEQAGQKHLTGNLALTFTHTVNDSKLVTIKSVYLSLLIYRNLFLGSARLCRVCPWCDIVI